MSITTTSFSPSTLIKSADINTNFTNITTAIPWSANPVAAKGDILAGTAANTAGALTVGTDGQVLTADSSQSKGIKWVTPASASNQLSTTYNLGIAASVATSALTVKITQGDGASDPTAGSPVSISFKNATITTGGYNNRSVTAAVSVVVPSGATLGMANSVANYIYVYALDNAGTVEAAVSGTLYDETAVLSTTTISSGATSNTVVYSTTGRSSVSIRLIGRVKITETSVGTWATAPSEVTIVSQSLPIVKIPTITTYTSGSGTYTTPAGVRYLRARIVGGGGGGGGSSDNSANGSQGGTGGSTTFGTSLLTAAGGAGGAGGDVTGGAGGAATINSPAVSIVAATGGGGTSGVTNSGAIQVLAGGGAGGNSYFGGGARGTADIGAGVAGAANTGGGGSGATPAGTSLNDSWVSGGGGAGAYVEAIIATPSATYAYAVGAGGAAGAAGSNGNNGGAGGSGFIIIEEHYL